MKRPFAGGCPHSLLMKILLKLMYMGCSRKTKYPSVIPKLKDNRNTLAEVLKYS